MSPCPLPPTLSAFSDLCRHFFGAVFVHLRPLCRILRRRLQAKVAIADRLETKADQCLEPMTTSREP